MHPLSRKWWIGLPVIALSVGSTFWLAWALGLQYPLRPLSIPRIALFFVSMSAFLQLYSQLFGFIVQRLFPSALGEERANS
jgi:hypothetical protein